MTTTLDPKTLEQLKPHLLRELAKRELAVFCELMRPDYQTAKHLQALIEKLEGVERGEIRRLIVCMPPRHGKSETAVRLFIAWFLGRNPSLQVVIAGYGAELVEGHSRAIRQMLDDDRYPFDARVSSESSAVARWATTESGLVIAVGVGSGLTGYGAHLLVIDDPVKDREAAESAPIRASTLAWYQDVARTRLMPGARQIVIGTRWHEEDLLGELLAADDSWDTLILPAIAEDNDPLGRPAGTALWPARFPIDELPSVERGEISSRSFSALYQQHPSPASGGVLKRAWFERRYDRVPDATAWMDFPDGRGGYANVSRRNLVVQSVDCASGTGVNNDFSAISTLESHGGDIYMRDVRRGRWEFAELIRQVRAAYANFKPDLLEIEAASAGLPLIQELRRMTGIPIVIAKPEGSKEARVDSVAAYFEASRVLLPTSAPWIAEFIDEATSFPVGRHDDMLDAVVHGVRRLVAYINTPPRRQLAWRGINR